MKEIEDMLQTKIYTLEIDGKPGVAFRAKDMPAALKASQRIGKTYIRPRKGNVALSVRLATIPERAQWMTEVLEDDEEWSFDCMVILDEDAVAPRPALHH